MLDFVSGLPAFILAISVLVAVHEYGHFWVARRLGFKVLRFSIGFGRPLLRFKPEPGWLAKRLRLKRSLPALATAKNAEPGSREAADSEVEYWISAIPLGGYVKMLDEREGPVPAEERHRAFNRRPIPHRIAVLLAGPGFNFLFAIVAYWAMFISGVPGIKPIVGDVAPDSLAARAGLRADDLIATIGGRSTQTWEQALVAILDELLADGIIDMQVLDADGGRRNVDIDVRGHESALTEPDALFSGLGIQPRPPIPAEIGAVEPGSPAERSGLAVGDEVLTADGEPIANWDDWVAFVRARPGATVSLELERDGRRLPLALDIGAVEENGATIGRIGAGAMGRLPDDVIERISTEERFGVLAAVPAAFGKTWEMTELTVRLLGNMMTGNVSVRNASGPIMIAAYAGDSAAAGFNAFLGFLSIISISLGIMNLLPIPILDGGQIVYQLAEWYKGSPLSERALLFGQQIGLALLLALMTLVFYNDITRLLG